MAFSSLRNNITSALDSSWRWLGYSPQVGHKPWLIAGLAAGLGVVLLAYLRRQKYPLPPGPMGYPLVGAIAEVSEEMHIDMMRLGKKYGDVFSLRIMTRLLVVLNSHKAIKEAFVQEGDLFAYRPLVNDIALNVNDEIFSAIYDGSNGEWVKNKKFLMSSLKSFGFGNVGSEERIQDGVNQLTKHLGESCGQPVDMSTLLPKVSAMVILSILFNKQHEFSGMKLGVFIERVRAWYDIASETVMFEMMPAWIGRIIFAKIIKRFGDAADDVRTLIRAEIDEHITNYDPENIRDFVDAYIQGRGLENIDMDVFTDTVFMFLPDAIDTITAAMQWVIFYVTKFKAVQEKIQENIDTVVGSGRSVAWADRHKLSYIEATIRESLRLGSPVTISAGHCSIRNTLFRGYFIPKEANVLANFYAVHMDPSIYEDPEEFRPERFLDPRGNLITNDQWMIFGIGRRMCVGEKLAKMELFLMISNLLQQYDFSFPEDQPEPPLKPAKQSVVRKPPPHQIRCTLRK